MMIKFCLILILISICGNAQLFTESFESENWHVTDKDKINLDSINAFLGLKSLKFEHTETDFNYAVKTIPIHIQKFSKFRISFYSLSNLEDGEKQIWIKPQLNKKNIYYTTFSIENGKDWKFNKIDFLIPKESDAIQIGFKLNGVGRFNVDEVKIEQIPIEENDTLFSIKNEKLIDSTLSIIQKNALNADKIDFNYDKKIALYLSNFSTEKELLSLNYLIEKLDDNHSYVSKIEHQNDNSNQKMNLPEGKILFEKYGYLKIPSLSQQSDSKAYSKYAITIQNLIKEIDYVKKDYWIIDLRDNFGGVVWPMISGLGSFLKNGKQGYFLYKNGEKQPWFYKNGLSRSNKESFYKFPRKIYTLKNKKPEVVVLINKNTSSSAEMLALIFSNYKNVTIVGEPSSGKTTGNSFYKLSENYALMLATSKMVNLTEEYNPKVEPDVLAENILLNEEDFIENLFTEK